MILQLFAELSLQQEYNDYQNEMPVPEERILGGISQSNTCMVCTHSDHLLELDNQNN